MYPEVVTAVGAAVEEIQVIHGHEHVALKAQVTGEVAEADDDVGAVGDVAGDVVADNELAIEVEEDSLERGNAQVSRSIEAVFQTIKKINSYTIHNNIIKKQKNVRT